jgi:hypothetical protein
MHKLKIAIDNLRTYLGKDREGLTLLREVATIGNQVRKDAAASRDAVTIAEKSTAMSAARVTALKQQLATVNKELDDERRDHQRTKGTLALAACEVREAQDKLDEYVEDIEPAVITNTTSKEESLNLDASRFPLMDLEAYKKMHKRMRSRGKCAPSMFMPGVWNVHDVIRSYNDLEYLGSIALAGALMNHAVTFCAQPNFPDNTGLTRDSKLDFMEWFDKPLRKHREECKRLVDEFGDSRGAPVYTNDWKPKATMEDVTYRAVGLMQSLGGSTFREIYSGLMDEDNLLTLEMEDTNAINWRVNEAAVNELHVVLNEAVSLTRNEACLECRIGVIVDFVGEQIPGREALGDVIATKIGIAFNNYDNKQQATVVHAIANPEKRTAQAAGNDEDWG